jgi:threonine/homoserine/homoserine lactone efflux protein
VLPLEPALAFAATAFLIELTPGPNMTYLALVAATEGRRRGYAAVAGVAVGLLVLGSVAVLGLAAVTQSNPLIYQGLRFAGVAYLLYLAWEAWRGSGSDEGSGALGTPALQMFWRGLLTNLLNPKAAAVFVTVMPGFVPPDAGAETALLLVAVYAGVATVVHLGIVIAAGAAQAWLTDAHRARIAGRLMGLALLGVAGWMLLKT